MEHKNKKQLLRAIFIFFVLFLFHSLLTPLYFSLIYNVEWSDTLLPSIVGWSQLILEYIVYWLIFSLLLQLPGKRWVAFFIAMVASLLQNAANLLLGYAMMGFPDSDVFFAEDLPASLWEFGFDLLLFCIAILIVHFVKRPIKLWFLALLPSTFHILSLVVFLIGLRGIISAGELGVLLDFVLDILCIFVARGAIPVIGNFLGRGLSDEKI